jgi:hypothetical protein
LYESLKPRITIRYRFRRALEFVDVNEVISCIVCVAKTAGMDLSDSFDFPRSPGKAQRKGKNLKTLNIDDILPLNGINEKEDSINLR